MKIKDVMEKTQLTDRAIRLYMAAYGNGHQSIKSPVKG